MAQKVKQVAKYPDLAKTGLILNTVMIIIITTVTISVLLPDEQYGCLLSTQAVLRQRPHRVSA